MRYFTVPANFAIDEEDALYEEEEDPVVEAPPHPKPSPVPSTSAPSDHSLEESVYAPPAFQDYPKELRTQCTILRVFAEELMDRHLRNEEFREIGFLYFDVQECRRRILKYIQCIDTEEEPGEPMYIPFWRKSTVEEEETHLFWLSQGL